MRQHRRRLLHWCTHLFLLLANKRKTGFDQRARAEGFHLCHRVPFLYPTKLFGHDHAQLRNNTSIDRVGRIPLGATTTRQAGAAACWTHAGAGSIVHPRSTIALRIEETDPNRARRYLSLFPSLGAPWTWLGEACRACWLSYYCASDLDALPLLQKLPLDDLPIFRRRSVAMEP